MVGREVDDRNGRPSRQECAHADVTADVSPPIVEARSWRLDDASTLDLITTPHAFGVSAPKLREIAKRLGRDHPLALALWETGWYEAHVLAALVADPARLTSAQMDRWARDFDNWGICDARCMHLFDRTRLAWRKVEVWSARRPEFVKRAGFALLATLAVHDKTGPDTPYRQALGWIEREATDERHFVKESVNWALRAIGRRNPELRRSAKRLATTLATSADSTARWIGKDALREFARSA